MIPIERRGAGFVVSGYVDNTTRRNNNIFNLGLGVAAGLAGGVFMNSGIYLTIIFVSGKPLLVDSIPYINDPKEQPVATCIDMRTGNFSF